MNKYMMMAFDIATMNIPLVDRKGGPFGAVIVQKDSGKYFAARNEVRERRNPTMHAEMVAINRAVEGLGKANLKDCEIYCTCFPCPMCLGAIMWAQIPIVYYGCRPTDAQDHFPECPEIDDSPLYSFITGNEVISKISTARPINTILTPIDSDECVALFTEWRTRERV